MLRRILKILLHLVVVLRLLELLHRIGRIFLVYFYLKELRTLLKRLEIYVLLNLHHPYFGLDGEALLHEIVNLVI
jgi:hypothetical protein